MRILAIEIGKETQDIIYNTEDLLENLIKLILPSSYLFKAQQIAKIGNVLYLNGVIMGVGKLNHILLDYINKGNDFIMEPSYSRTKRDYLDQVKSLGINITEDNVDYTSISLSGIKIIELSKFLLEHDLDLVNDLTALSIFNQSYNQILSYKDFSFDNIRKCLIELNIFSQIFPILEYYSIIVYYIVKESKFSKPIIIDSKFGSICEFVNDNPVKDLESYFIENDHTILSLNGKIQDLFEHHVHTYKLEDYIIKIAIGQISNNEIYNVNGYDNSISTIDNVIVRCPKSNLIENINLDFHHTYIGGDL